MMKPDARRAESGVGFLGRGSEPPRSPPARRVVSPPPNRALDGAPENLKFGAT